MPNISFMHVGDATNGTPKVTAEVSAPAMRTLQELATVDPADMTTAELVATWKGDTDPDSAPDDGERRHFNCSTRGASDGPARKYPVNAPAFVLHGERLPATPRDFNAPYLRAIFAPTKADTARLAARPIALVGPARRLTGEYIPARKAPGRWGVEAYAYTVDAHRSRVIAAAGALALEIATDWAYEIGKPAAPALEGGDNV